MDADPILQQHKFTKRFRAADRKSPIFDREVIYNPNASPDAEEVFFDFAVQAVQSTSAWEVLEGKNYGMPTWKGFQRKSYARLKLGNAKASGVKIWESRTCRTKNTNEFAGLERALPALVDHR